MSCAALVSQTDWSGRGTLLSSALVSRVYSKRKVSVLCGFLNKYRVPQKEGGLAKYDFVGPEKAFCA